MLAENIMLRTQPYMPIVEIEPVSMQSTFCYVFCTSSRKIAKRIYIKVVCFSGASIDASRPLLRRSRRAVDKREAIGGERKSADFVCSCRGDRHCGERGAICLDRVPLGRYHTARFELLAQMQCARVDKQNDSLNFASHLTHLTLLVAKTLNDDL